MTIDGKKIHSFELDNESKYQHDIGNIHKNITFEYNRTEPYDWIVIYDKNQKELSRFNIRFVRWIVWLDEEDE